MAKCEHKTARLLFELRDADGRNTRVAPDSGLSVLFLVVGQERGRIEWIFPGARKRDRILRAMVEAALEVGR